MKKNVIFALGIAFSISLAVAAPSDATQQQSQSPQVVSAQPPQDSKLKERVDTYYQDLVKGESAAAFEFVAPESKNDFFKMHTDGLTGIQVLGIDQAGSAGTIAQVKVRKSVRPPQFGTSFDFDYVETWKEMDGQWYVVLPNSKDAESPFGKMRSDGQGNSSQAAPGLADIQKKAETNAKNADPDQYLLALKKAMGQTQPQSLKDPKSDDKDKKKTDPAQDPKPKQNN